MKICCILRSIFIRVDIVWCVAVIDFTTVVSIFIQHLWQYRLRWYKSIKVVRYFDYYLSNRRLNIQQHHLHMTIKYDWCLFWVNRIVGTQSYNQQTVHKDIHIWHWWSPRLNHRHSNVNTAIITIDFILMSIRSVLWLQCTRNLINSSLEEFFLLISVFIVLMNCSTENRIRLPIFWDSYLRSETNFYLMFISIEVNWTWWRRASFYLKAFPVLIKQVSTN